MAQRSLNPVRNAFKHAAEGRNLKEVVKRQNEGLKKEARDATVRKRRNIVVEVSPQVVDEKQGKGTKFDKRREQLLTWKAQRDRQRQQEVKKRTRQGEFVVKHVQYSPAKYLVAESKKNIAKMDAAEKQVPKRITRSSAKIANKVEEERKKKEKEQAQSKLEASKRSQTAAQNGVKRRITRSSKKETQIKEVSEEIKREESVKIERKGSAKKKQEKSGFAFSFDVGAAIPKTFNFNKVSPVISFVSNGFDDPIAKFNESLKIEKETSFDKGKIRSSFMAIGSFDDPIAKFNASLKTESTGQSNGFKSNRKLKETRSEESLLEKEKVIQISKQEEVFFEESQTASEMKLTTVIEGSKNDDDVPTCVLRNTPQRSGLVGKTMIKGKEKNLEMKDIEMGTPNSKIKGLPGKTPKRTLPKHLIEEVDADKFTPRRIKSTKHFKELVEKERENFNQMNAKWQAYLEAEQLEEEVCGHVRTVIGQAQLLMDQRFKQFENLIQLHQSHQEDKGATASDLQGFWDMISYQIEDVHQKFSELDKRKQNDWKSEETKKINKTKKVIETKYISQPKKKKDGDKVTARQEAARKFKQAMRARMQSLKNSNKETDVEIEAANLPENMKPTSPSTESVFDDVSQNDDSSSGRSRASTGDMSCDSLEGGEKVADKNCALLLCTALENVQIKTNDVTENNEISPEKRKTVRRSMRKTPSKYKTPLKDIENVWVNREEMRKVTNKLFTESNSKEENDGDFMKYLRPSVSDENQEDLFGLGFSSPSKKKREPSQIHEEVSLIKFD